jgi:hypothetical protein
MARASLQKGVYADAGKYADSALSRQNTLLDLQAYAANRSTLPLKLKDPEVIFVKRISVSSALPLSTTLLNVFDTAIDLRYQLFTTNGANFQYAPFTDRGYYRPYITGDGAMIGPNVPEMMLIKAESEARVGSYPVAIDLVNNLRTKRFKTADYTAVSAADATEALKLVLVERRRELFCRGLRWFDQKRLNKEAAFAETVTRVFLGQTYTLEPNSNRYVFPIADKYIQLNPEITQNPR